VQAFQAQGLSSFLGFPLIAQQKLIGTLKVWVNSPEPLTPEQIAIAQEVADRLALSVQQYRKQQQLVRYTTQLEQRVGELGRPALDGNVSGNNCISESA
jgi:GAF domain-containing protein